jgi:hypothetical protein
MKLSLRCVRGIGGLLREQGEEGKRHNPPLTPPKRGWQEARVGGTASDALSYSGFGKGLGESVF